MADFVTDEAGRSRCSWCVGDPEYCRYHDEEWGVPVDDDNRLFEKMCLEGFQSGLSWLTILKRRPAFRDVFLQFDFEVVAQMTPLDVDRLVADPSIIRHRGKIEATIQNASRAVQMRQRLGSLAKFFWSFEPATPAARGRHADIPAITNESTAMSRELKRLGWKFVGPTTCYALMQAMGLVNDHLIHCDDHARINTLRSKFRRP